MFAETGKLTLFVDRFTQQWIVLDTDGNFWTLSTFADNPWEQRMPFHQTEETELEPVPGHYKPMFGIPT